MQGDRWGPSQHTGPLNEKNDQLSPALLKAHLHPVRFHYGRGPAPELQDRTKPECTDHAIQAPISLTWLTGPADSWFSCVKVFWLLSSLLISPHYLCCALGKEQVIIRVPETPLLFFYTITVQYVHLKASAERIKPAKCWALNKLYTGWGGGWGCIKRKQDEAGKVRSTT